MTKPEKDLYCPTCKEYPDRIIGAYDWAIEYKEWINDCYELQDIDYGDSHAECAKCGAALEYKPQEESDANPLPEVSREVSSEKDIPEGK